MGISRKYQLVNLRWNHHKDNLQWECLKASLRWEYLKVNLRWDKHRCNQASRLFNSKIVHQLIHNSENDQPI
jgi:hypothetical protein